MKVDFHIHSRFSQDGRMSIVEILNISKIRNISAVAITDHNSIRGSLLAREEAKGKGVIVIRGTEVSSSAGHIAALGIDEDIPKKLSPEETIERIHALGGIAIAVHPYRRSNGVGGDVVRRCRFDAIEVLNSSDSRHKNVRALSMARELSIGVTGGSDAHRKEEIGKAYGIIDDCESEEEVFDAILKRKVKPEGEFRTTGVFIRDAFETTIDWIRRGFRRL